LAADRGRRPGDDLLSLIAADPDLQRDDIVVTAILIAVAGHETTANLLGAAIVRLLTRRPDGGRLLMTERRPRAGLARESPPVPRRPVHNFGSLT
jgi:cytochrome P450